LPAVHNKTIVSAIDEDE